MVLGSVLLLVGCQKVDVMGGLSEAEAVDLIVLLRQNGISASKTGVGSGQDVLYSVTVSQPDASNAFLVLAENDRPRPEPQGFAELYGKSKMIPTETEERALFLHAQSGELERTIESMPSVIDARVHVSLPQRDRLAEYVSKNPAPEPTAAVFVKHWIEDDKTPASARLDVGEIRELVASSIDGLDKDHVTVVKKGIAPDTRKLPRSGPDPMMFFYPLAGLTVLLVGLSVFLLLRNRSLSRQLHEAPTRAAATRS
ncbi:MAG: secretion protein [Candidatus Eisenbacteria bacterium]